MCLRDITVVADDVSVEGGAGGLIVWGLEKKLPTGDQATSNGGVICGGACVP